MTLDDEDLSLLKAVSAGEISWREGLYDLGLSNAEELLALLAQHKLPSPFVEPNHENTSDLVAFITHTGDDAA